MSIKIQFSVIKLIKKFFENNNFLEVITPPAVENPGMETHIHPFQLHSVHKKKNIPLFLHTSPEFCMKEILSQNDFFDRIYQITYCFRDEPTSPFHRNQFLMLEWYRKNERYEKIMSDFEDLIAFLISEAVKYELPIKKELTNEKIVKKTMQELFLEFTGIDILNFLEKDQIKKLLKTLPEVPTPDQDLEWDDYFFLIYLNLIEPKLNKYPLLLIYEFPGPLSALSTIKESNPSVCERFEVYINGIELCNCFNELTNYDELKMRFKEQNRLKQKLYSYQLPEPKRFYEVMKNGYPPSSGIALGVERLIKCLFDVDKPFWN